MASDFIERVHLVGASLGSTLAAYYAANHPQQVESLTLLGFPDQLFSKERTTDAVLREFFDTNSIQTVEDFQFYYRRAFYQPPSVPKIVLRYNLREFLKYRETLRSVLMELAESRPVLMASLRQIKLPTIILHGEADQISEPGHGDFWQLHIPHADYRLVEECGHMIHIEKPDEVARLHKQLLRSVAFRSRSSQQPEEETGRFSVVD